MPIHQQQQPKSLVLADLHYFPNLEFFSAIVGAEAVVFDPMALYSRQTYFNRTRVRLANKVETLSVPIQGRRPRLPQQEIRIDYSQKWVNVHLRGIQSAYGKSPFFEFYFPYFEKIFGKAPELLWDLNWQLLTLCLRLLGMPVKMLVVSGQEKSSGIRDIKGQILPSGHDSESKYYEPQPYFQLFGVDFEPNLSILDLLFCEGPASKNIILKSVKKQ